MTPCFLLTTVALLGFATSTAALSPRIATRIIRFLDADGIERHGTPTDAELKSAELIDGDIFGARQLTGKMAVVAQLLSPVKTTPAIYGIGCNYKVGE